METEKLAAWADDVALQGPEAPQWNGHIEHLIQYLLTIHKRFGNTAITASLKWGASALWKRDEQAERIAQLETELAQLRAELERMTLDRDAKSKRMWELGKEAESAESRLREAREYIIEASKDVLGGGDDPVGFLIASHRLISAWYLADKGRLDWLENEGKHEDANKNYYSLFRRNVLITRAAIYAARAAEEKP